MTRFNFTQANKPQAGTRFAHPEPNAETVRLTNKNLWIGAILAKRLKRRDGRIIVRIEKDASSGALRLTPSTLRDPQAFRFSFGHRHNDAHTARPAALYDMANGSYVEDLKEERVFILDN